MLKIEGRSQDVDCRVGYSQLCFLISLSTIICLPMRLASLCKLTNGVLESSNAAIAVRENSKLESEKNLVFNSNLNLETVIMAPLHVFGQSSISTINHTFSSPLSTCNTH